MRTWTTGLLFACGLMLVTSFTAAQPPGGGRGGKGKGGERRENAKSATVEDLVATMMAFDKNGDGKLTRDELTDQRLHRLFDRADADKDGVVTKEELTAMFTKMLADDRGGRGGPGGPGGPGGGPGGFGPPGGGPGGPGGPGGFGPPGGRGPGMFGGPPQPGQILPPFLQEMLRLTDEQKKQLTDLQKEVDDKLGKILTDEQKKQLKDMRDRGPGRFGPPGGGPGGRGGPPGGPGGGRGPGGPGGGGERPDRPGAP